MFRWYLSIFSYSYKSLTFEIKENIGSKLILRKSNVNIYFNSPLFIRHVLDEQR